MAALPLKVRILQYAIQKETSFTVDDVMNDLASEYPGEKMFNKKLISEYIDAMIGVGFLKNDDLELDANGELVIHAIVTEYGKERQKYIK